MISTEPTQQSLPILTSLMYRKAKGEFDAEGIVYLDRAELVQLVREYEAGDGRNHMREREMVRRCRAGDFFLADDLPIRLKEDRVDRAQPTH